MKYKTLRSWKNHVCLPINTFLFLCLLTSLPTAHAADDNKSKGSSLGGLLDSLKDLKVPDSVSKLPQQLKELKDAYLKTTKTVEDLQKEVATLREEVATLREQQSQSEKTVPTKIDTGSAQILEVTAEQLVEAFQEDRISAKKSFSQRYLKVKGAIQSFETGAKEIVIYLRANGTDARVKCHFKRDNNFHVEVVSSQGRLVSRNDRTTLLTVGQPLTVIGTCTGKSIDVTLVNCHAEGLNSKRIAEDK
ncbi:MAG: hypothetical protein L3J39_10050 [Verrucomicrobiales bacterium]|nr:hypothetical protein [Verrucomicrobiales bacterium]